MNIDEDNEDLELSAALHELSRHAPAGPNGMDVLAALKRRSRRRLMIAGGLAVVVGAGATWVVLRQQEPIRREEPVQAVCEVSPSREQPFFSVVSVGDFSPGVGSAVKSPRSGFGLSMPVLSMNVPNVSITTKGK